MNVRTNGLYEMVDYSTLVINADKSAEHEFIVYGDAVASFLSTGSSPTQETKLSTTGDAGDDYFNVDSSTNFQTGDWCSIHFRYSDLKSREDWVANSGYPTGRLTGDGVSQSRMSLENTNHNHHDSTPHDDAGTQKQEIKAKTNGREGQKI